MTKKVKNFYLLFSLIIVIAIALAVLYRKYFQAKAGKPDITLLHEKYYYLNLDKDVKYEGDKKCISCHSEIHEDFHKTGMGKSLYKPSADNEIEDFEKKNEIFDPKSGYYYQAYRQGNEYFQKEFRKDKNGNITHELIKKAEYVIGSGNNTRSYLYSENGFFYEMPMSWYSEKAEWNLSPGYEKLNLRFSRPVIQECMNCHNDYTEFVQFSENKFKVPIAEGISCERCHGPGELHILRQKEKNDLFKNIESDTIDRTIVNPADLPLQEKLSVCFQCHLQGDVRVFAEEKLQTDFKPGMKLEDIKTVFVQDVVQKGDFKIASHAARMILSDCFVKSNGQLTCITCHDPHKPVKTVSKKFFNDKCLDCHNVTTLSPSTQNADHNENGNCINCHMRQGATKDVLHVNFTDHWIRKEIKAADDDQTENPSIPVTLKNINNPDDKFSQINLGIAYVSYFDSKHPHSEYLKRAIPLLEESLKKFPEHKNGLYWLGVGYIKAGRYADAVRTLEKAVLVDTGNALAYFQLATSYEKSKNILKAIDAYNKSLRIFPENADALNSLGNLYYNSGKTREALEVYGKALEINPNNSAVLNNLGDVYLYKLQKPDEAKNFFQSSLKADPEFIPALNNLGNAFMLEGNTAEAERIFKEVIGKDPKSVLAYGNLAVLYEDKKQFTEARQMLNRVLEIDPNDVRAKQMLEKLGK